MAKSPKLKVFRTPVGFHDAYVAAPSQKAALEAWGADSNLFARGEAEVVDDPQLAKAPLAQPGEVVRVLRGSAAEQVKALGGPGGDKGRKSGRSAVADLVPTGSGRKKNEAKSEPAKKKPKPSRAALDKAEATLATADEKHRRERDKLLREEEKLRERRRALEGKQSQERRRLEEAADAAREDYRAAMADWEL